VRLVIITVAAVGVVSVLWGFPSSQFVVAGCFVALAVVSMIHRIRHTENVTQDTNNERVLKRYSHLQTL